MKGELNGGTVSAESLFVVDIKQSEAPYYHIKENTVPHFVMPVQQQYTLYKDSNA